jgi:hypothetical protein
VPPYSWAVDPQGRLLASLGLEDLYRVDGDHVETLLAKSRNAIRLINVTYCVGNRTILGGEKGVSPFRIAT